MVETEFHEMIPGYDREITTFVEASKRFGVEYSLPIITNNEKIVSGDLIPAYVEELRNLMHDWQAFQGTGFARAAPSAQFPDGFGHDRLDEARY